MNRHILTLTLTELTDSFEPSRKRIMENTTLITKEVIEEEESKLGLVDMMSNWLSLGRNHYRDQLSNEFKSCTDKNVTANKMRSLASMIEAAIYECGEISIVHGEKNTSQFIFNVRRNPETDVKKQGNDDEEF